MRTLSERITLRSLISEMKKEMDENDFWDPGSSDTASAHLSHAPRTSTPPAKSAPTPPKSNTPCPPGHVRNKTTGACVSLRGTAFTGSPFKR